MTHKQPKEKINTIIQGDCLEVLKTLESESVDCVITSPPYWGLRDYGTAKWECGDENCDHMEIYYETKETPGGRGGSMPHRERQYKNKCRKCGAKRIDKQLGLEKTPEEYVAKMVEVFSEVKRVLKKEGTCWLNLGDSYANNGTGGNGATGGRDKSTLQSQMPPVGTTPVKKSVPLGLKSKDLVGIPWRVAFALQTDGWYLRQDIIWHKPNPMPESVTDRCTKAHEYIFLLAKSPKYYFDNEAIKERATWIEDRPSGMERNGEQYRDKVRGKYSDTKKYGGGGTTFVGHSGYTKADGTSSWSEFRNRRSVWTITTKPFKDAHFATFPEDLIVPMIKAGCPKNGVVLDPFIGSGTTAVVARRLGRNYLGIELNPAYIKMAEKRLSQQVLI
jgi:DNA modification methylase